MSKKQTIMLVGDSSCKLDKDILARAQNIVGADREVILVTPEEAEKMGLRPEGLPIVAPIFKIEKRSDHLVQVKPSGKASRRHRREQERKKNNRK